jgi:hypothetical protein
MCQVIRQGFSKEYKLTVDGINLKYIFLICYICNWLQEKKIAGWVKQLTVPLFPGPNCSMPKNDAKCVIPVKYTSDHLDRWADEHNALFVSKQWCAPIIYLYGMLTLQSAVDLWLCACIYDNTIVMSCLFREQLKWLFLGAGDDLWTVAVGTIENKWLFWYTFHPFVVFTDHNTVSFINKMQSKK